MKEALLSQRIASLREAAAPNFTTRAGQFLPPALLFTESHRGFELKELQQRFEAFANDGGHLPGAQ